MTALMESRFLLTNEETLEQRLAQIGGEMTEPERWHPQRLIFRNFWFFRKKEIVWHHGRLFLGGQNRAGKSIVLSMAVPVLLDGEKSDERLQTFGGEGRGIAYYITGYIRSESGGDRAAGDAAFSESARTSYIALEFSRKEGSETQYLTIGQGMYHNREAADKGVKSWGFAITDGRRLGRPLPDGSDFDVVKQGGISLDKGELRRLLTLGGQVFDTNRDYAVAVNNLLFGYKDIKDYHALVDLLVQTRSPGLAQKCKPSDIVEILEKSLPKLSDTVTQNIGESLDHIDQTLKNRERNGVRLEAARALDKATTEVYRRHGELAAAVLVEAHAKAAADQAAWKDVESKLADRHQEYRKISADVTCRENKQQEITEQRRQLSALPVFGFSEELHQTDEDIAAGVKEKETKESQRLEAEKHLPSEWAPDLVDAFQSLREADCTEALASCVPAAAVAQTAKDREQQIDLVAAALVEHKTAQRVLADKRSAEELARRFWQAADDEVTRALSAVDDHRREAGEAIRAWAAATEVLQPKLVHVEQAVQAFLSCDAPLCHSRVRHGTTLIEAPRAGRGNANR